MAAVDQKLDFIPCGSVRFGQKPSDDVIAARVYPVILRFCHTSVAQVAAVINHIPWTIYSQITKHITVIPFLNRIILAGKSIVFQHLPDFRIRKTKIFLITHIFYSVYLEIIESGKYTFL